MVDLRNFTIAICNGLHIISLSMERSILQRSLGKESQVLSAPDHSLP